jgi:Lrp/AsnC family transcriptional regulator for asnA, asnC and gidA
MGYTCSGDVEVKNGMIKNMDNVDLQIINLLQEDCRLSFNKIANKIGISAGTAFNHVKNLEKNGILKSYTVNIDPSKVGYSLTAIVLIQVEGGHLQDVEDKIANLPNVIAVYDVTGDYNAVVITKFKDGAGLNTFIKNLLAIPHVRRTVTNVALSVIKEDFRIKL